MTWHSAKKLLEKLVWASSFHLEMPLLAVKQELLYRNP